MQISGIGANYPSYFSRSTSNMKLTNPKFDNFIVVTTQKQIGTSDTQFVQKTGSISDPKKADFSNMTPAAFSAEGYAMFNRGEIDFDTMTAMVLRSDSIARMDAESGISQNHNFVEIFKGYISFLEKSGSRNDPTSGYNTLQKVMDKIS